VAFSRVKFKEDVRLLLMGSYDTITYITSKQPEQSILDFFAGYDDDGVWNKQKTIAALKITNRL
jgi:hypothetical protein